MHTILPFLAVLKLLLNYIKSEIHSTVLIDVTSLQPP